MRRKILHPAQKRSILFVTREKASCLCNYREKFNTYRFLDYKEDVIDLLQRVTIVSVETMKIVSAMPAEEGSQSEA